MSDCNICIGGGDYEPIELYKTTMPKAIKPHKCCECHRQIPTGTIYQNVSGLCAGTFETFKTCLDCMNIREGLDCGEGVGLGGLWAEIHEVFPDVVSTACINKIPTASAKAFFLEQWRKWKGL